jgi:hypothetical protein
MSEWTLGSGMGMRMATTRDPFSVAMCVPMCVCSYIVTCIYKNIKRPL